MNKGVWQAFRQGVFVINKMMAYLSALLIVACALVLMYEVMTRYVIHYSNDWVIEASVFMLIAATFMASGHTQKDRAHVGIELLDEIMAPKWKRYRLLFGDALSFLFCLLITVLTWKYFYLAYSEGWDSGSTWAPKLWIPYSFMALGMTSLNLQFVIQIVDGVRGTGD
ncbi:TRAP transporter small permease [Limnobacter litoralis]|uniref:TRAP transporter small permease protein n=1 Tax=Limnobacter litoralis TaxID=481366 RepID=A0ABQ5YUC8_9BURK|nr:TRAP transporter small permease [Limnobacter litoralis]GLR27526.1 hypothetical protein GCM10007875_26170 [Limnobacter litoralis]